MVKSKISILIPTRDRFDNLVRLINSIEETSKDFNNIEVLLYVDDDDKKTIDSIKQNRKKLHGAKVYVGKRTTLGSAYNALYKNCDGDIIMSSADDIVFKTKNWDYVLNTEYNKLNNKIALFAPNDLYTDPEDFCTHPFLTRAAINNFGFFVPTEFDCNYADRWYTDIFKQIDRYICLPIIVEHLHWLNGKAVRDDTYNEGSANMNRHSEHVYKESSCQRNYLATKLQFSIDNTNDLITIVINTRRKDNENTGSITQFLTNLTNSLYSPNNIEIIFKIDTDDNDSQEELDSIINNKQFPITVKYVNTERVFYKGLHIGYKQAFDIRDNNSKVVFAMADDFYFIADDWDKEILKKIKHFNKNDIFILTDYLGEAGRNPIAPGWSTKLIELSDGFGPTYSTDYWTSLIGNELSKKDERTIVYFTEFSKRHTTELDGPSHPRWDTDREEMIQFHKTKEYKDYSNNLIKKLIRYHESTVNGK